MPEKPVHRKITKAKLKKFIKRYNEDPERIPYKTLKESVRLYGFSPSRLLIVKKEFYRDRHAINKFFKDWSIAVKEGKIKSMHYSIKKYNAYPLIKNGDVEHTIASYYLRPTISDLYNYYDISSDHKRLKLMYGLKMVYAKRLIKRSGLTPIEFKEKLIDAEHELVGGIDHINRINYIEGFDYPSVFYGL